MSENAVAVIVVGVVVCGAMGLIYWLSSRETDAAIRGETRVQKRENVRLGIFYSDPEDERVWVPRPRGNGWDPNLATLGGKLIWGVLGLAVLSAVVGGIATLFA